MTRAMHLLFAGDLGGSFAMHPLAAATVLAQGALAVLSVYLTFRDGHPFDLWKGKLWNVRLGRAVVVFNGALFVLLFVVWALRGAGFFGGPVPV
jgi:hypothetical protein